MYGAILGDIIGSPFEFDRGDKTKNFDLFSEGCGFTDDSVMTIAVGERYEFHSSRYLMVFLPPSPLAIHDFQ